MIAFAIALWLLLWISAPDNELSRIKANYPDLGFVESIRAGFLGLIGDTPSDERALVAGLAIGERSLLSDQTADQMRELSLTHLVAVSGANLAIVIGAVWFLLASLGFGRNARFAAGLAVMGFYVLLVGPESSVIRAATMASFVTVSLWLGRGSSPLHALALAVSFILLLDPGLATDFGFGLSALATTGLLVAAGPIYESLSSRLPDWLAMGVASAAAAQIFTTPILLMLQPGLPLYAVLANLLVEPVVAPVTILGISAAVLALPLPAVSTLLIQLAAIATGWIVWVASQLSGLPFARLHFVAPPLGVVLSAALVIFIAIYFQSSSQAAKRFAMGLSVAVFLLAAAFSAVDVFKAKLATTNWEILNCDVGQGDALLLRSGNQVALIDVGPDSDALGTCLNFAGVGQIDLLVLSHYDSDHVAGIEGIGQRPIGLTLLSGFDDDRPLVSKVANFLAEKAAETQIGQRGLAGQLGECRWQVLSPTFDAAEAVDSNDASVIVEFECPGFELLTLGDLGEQGQNRLLPLALAERDVRLPLVVKVAHHGSADQSRTFYEKMLPQVALFSVGSNSFGHPTDRGLRVLHSTGARIFRTDIQGAIALRMQGSELRVTAAGKLAS